MNKNKAYQFIYGPVSSWRIGRSLGVDIISSRKKACTFNCLYCQLGRNRALKPLKKIFVPVDKIIRELKSIPRTKINYLTFSGMGEPTLASNLGQAINIVKTILGLPVAVLTNSSLMSRKDVCQELARADVVVAKLDAPNERLFRTINRPAAAYFLDEILQGIRRFRSEFSGKLALQMMFIEANKDVASEMAKIAERLSPDEVQLNTPLRPCAVKPLPAENMSAIREAFSGFRKVLTVYEAPRVGVAPLNLEETRRRRPKERR